MSTAQMHAFTLLDIYTIEGSFRSAPNFKFANFETVKAQTRQQVTQAVVLQMDDGRRMLRVTLEMAVRWLGADTITEKAQIELLFAAEYVFTGEPDKATIDNFALNVTPYNVWPYFREYVANLSARMSLPRLTLPALTPGANTPTWPQIEA